jgi:Fe-S cluster biogenesis protein NfuA
MSDTQSIEAQIENLINTEIAPFIEMDGGHIRFVELKDNVVYVELSGACGHCPSSTLTLKGGVETVIKRRFPEIKSVELAGLNAMFTH